MLNHLIGLRRISRFIICLPSLRHEWLVDEVNSMGFIQKANQLVRSFADSFGRSELNVAEGLRRLLTEAMPICPLCRQQMNVHRYQHIASTPFGGEAKGSFDSMMNAVKSHAWDELLGFQKWEGTSPDADVYLLECPDERLLLAVIYCPYELGDIYKLLHYEQVERSEVPIKKERWSQV